jgi:Methyltransferase domain
LSITISSIELQAVDEGEVFLLFIEAPLIFNPYFFLAFKAHLTTDGMNHKKASKSQLGREPQVAQAAQAAQGKQSRSKPIKGVPQHAQTDLHALVGGQSIELLKALHILTREGQLNQDSRRKLKQVNHLVQLLEGPLRACAQELGSSGAHALSLVDHGAGKSYLGFILYDRFGQEAPASVAFPHTEEGVGSSAPFALNVFAIETRPELVERSIAMAQTFGFKGMQFFNVLAQDALALKELPERVDVVTALHACDSLTDDAIEFALAKSARLIFLVPCCQAEAASILKSNRALQLRKTPLAELWRHPLHTRELGSQVTNVLRCLYLEAMGYTVTVTELVGWEHSMKNELMVAKYTGQPKPQAAARLWDLVQQFGLEPLVPARFSRLEKEASAQVHADDHANANAHAHAHSDDSEVLPVSN